MAKKEDPKAKKEEKKAKAAPEKKDAKAADKKANKPAEEKKKIAPAKKEAKSEPKTKVRIVEVDDDNDGDNEVKNSVKAYHVSFRADLNKWQVKLAKGEKALKTFVHQSEAIDFAKEMANNQEGYIVIHKKTGKIRTQRYGKD